MNAKWPRFLILPCIILALFGVWRWRQPSDRAGESLMAKRVADERKMLASVDELMNKGKYAEAVKEYRAVQAIIARLRGIRDPDALSVWSKLAAALHAQGKFAEAEKEYQNLLFMRWRTLGEGHPETLDTQNCLAFVLQDQGRHQEAEERFRKVLALRKDVLGEEHPDTLQSRINLAEALLDLAQYAEAEQEHRMVLEIQEHLPRTDQFAVSQSSHSLALCLDFQGKRREALEFMRRAEIGFAKVLGADHPDAKSARKNRESMEASLKVGK